MRMQRYPYVGTVDICIASSVNASQSVIHYVIGCLVPNVRAPSNKVKRGGRRDNRQSVVGGWPPLVCFPHFLSLSPPHLLVVLGLQIPRDGRHGHSWPQLRGRQGRCEVGVDADGLSLALHLSVR